MAKLQGKNVLLYIYDTTGTPAYKVAVCATSSSMEQTADQLDTSSKCDDGYSSSLPGRKSATISMSGYAETSPASGALSFEAIQALYAAGTELDFRIGNATPITGFANKFATGVITSLNLNFSDGEAVQFDMTISVNGAITTVDPNV